MVWQKENESAYEAFLKKHKWILVFFVFLFICLSMRLFYLQIVRGSIYQKVSEQQRIHNTHERAPRGIIYSADNTVLAENRFSYVALFYPFGQRLSPSDESIRALNKF